MTEEEFFQEMVTWLQGDDPYRRVRALEFFMEYPTNDPKILALIESLLEDRTIAKVSIPITFQEVRRFAAFALAAGRAKAGINEVVRIQGTFAGTYSYGDLHKLAEKFNVLEETRYIGSSATICRLIELGAIRVYDLTLDPKDGVESFRNTRMNLSRTR